ncbi:ATP-binding protein [Ferrimonas pelagia]|uniref:ATPase n=1 Tax=Ferrimonas pelagia TaxID=1177826 RepID=A0ABP9ES60_9GAMM
MSHPVRTLLSWSSGKDSAWALHQLQQDPNIELVGLFTTINREAGRVAIHGIRESLLDAQAHSAGLPLYRIPLPFPCSNEQYQACMTQFQQQALADGVEAFAFGDLLLEDVRDYRVDMLKDSGIQPLFPLWGRATPDLAHTMITAGLKARIVCLQHDKLDQQMLGREFDHQLLADLPAGIDPCGENGEFHTFAWNGPMFRHPIPVTSGTLVVTEHASFIDLLGDTAGTD